MKNMVETIAGANLVMKAVFAICAFILAIVLMPVGTAHAAYSVPSNAQDSGTSGGCTWYVTSASASSNPGQLVIYPTNGTSGTLASIREDSSPWNHSTAIQSIYVAPGVKTASNFNWVFRECTSLVSADIANLDTSGATDISGLFYGCTALKSIDGIGSLNVAKVTTIESMFANCDVLESLDLSKWNCAALTSVYEAFERCYALKTLVLPGSMPKLTNAAYAFNSCQALTSLDVSCFENGVLEDVYRMFQGCYELKNLTGYEEMVTTKVTSLDGVFSNCRSMLSLDISKWKTANVTTFSSLFGSCRSIESIKGLDVIDTSKGKDFSYMFSHCWELPSIEFGTNFKTSASTNFSCMFSRNESLKVLDISMFDTASAINMKNMFSEMDLLQQVTLGAKFSFTGNGTATECVLPTPDPAYIDGATGNWQAVGSGTVSAPAGTVYAPADVPSNVAETYVMEAAKVPVLAASDTWYKGTMDKSAIVTINIVDSYSAGGTESESWDASAAQDGSVMAYVSSDGTALTIAGNGSGYIKANADSSFAFDSFSSAIAINGTELLDTENVTRMDSMFSDCTALKSLNLDNWDVSNVYMFNVFAQDCTSLTSFGPNNLRDWDVSGAEWFSNSFMGCESLEAIDVSLWDMSSCGVLNYMFSDCKSLTTLDVSKWNLASATKAAYVFRNCTGLSTLDFANWNTPKVLDMSGLLNGCAFVTIDVSGLDMGTCEQMDWFFANCKSLTSIAGINEWDVSSAQLMGDMFRNCVKLAELDLSSWKTDSMTGCMDIFSGCESLEKLDISGFSTSGAAVSGMFDKCYRLQQVTLGVDFTFNGKNDVRSVDLPTPDPTYIPGATGKWQAVADGTVDDPKGTVYLPADVPSNVAETYVVYFQKEPILAAGSSWYKADALRNTIVTINIVDSYTADSTELESWDASAAGDGSVMAYILADGTTLTIAGNGSGVVYANPDSSCAFGNVDNYTSNGNEFTALTTFNGADILDVSKVTDATRMFYYAQKLQALDVSGWDVSNVVTFDSTFAECRALTTLAVGSWDISSAESLHNLFGQCRALTSLDVSGWDTAGVKDMGSMFEFCRVLPSLDVSGFDTSSCTDTSGMFYACTALGNIDMSGWDTSQVTDMNAMFASCAKFTKLDVTGFDTSKVEDFSFMFQSLLSLSTLDVSGFDTSSAVDMGNMFAQSSRLTYLDVTGFETSKVEDFRSMFNDCESLLAVDVTGFDTTSCTRFSNMFMNCKSLKVLDLSSFDTSKADDMAYLFYNMYRLQQVTLGEKFSFTGDGTATDCVLPTPDPTYITGAIGKWQAVGAGTVAAPLGTIYLPEEVPSNVAETYVMPPTAISVDVPIKVTLAAAADGTWCTPTATANQIINHSLVPVKVASAQTSAADGFTMLADASVEGSTTSNVFGGTITAGAGAAQDLTAIDTSADAWTMAAETDSDDSDLISLQLAGSIGNVEGKYFTSGLKLFDITYTFELAL